MLAGGGSGESFEKPEDLGECVDGETDGDSGGVGKVKAKSVVSIRAAVSKSISGKFNEFLASEVLGCARSSSGVFVLG